MSFQSRPIREERDSSASLEKLVRKLIDCVRSIAGLRSKVHMIEEEMEEAARVRHRRVRLLKRTATVGISLLAVLLLFAGMTKGLVALKVFSLSNVFAVTGADLPADENGFTNVLLLGTGDKTHDGVDLTDTIMIASMDPEQTKSAVLLSLPRDLYVLKTEKMGEGRVNSLFRNYKTYLVREGMEPAEAAQESLKQLSAEIGKLIGLNIHHTIKVDFVAFEQAIDAIGGIDVEVKQDIVDTEYPGPNYTYETFTIRQGLQHIDGPTALKYARSRHTTSDFSRSARQQQIISAAAQKVTESGLVKNISKITELYGIVAHNVETTMTTRELIGLAGLGKKLDHDRIISMQLSDMNGLYGSFAEPGGFLYAPPRDQFDGASVLLPVSIPEFPVTWKQVHALGELLFRHRQLFIGNTRIAILNAVGKSGLAGKLGGELSRYGLNVTSTANAASPSDTSYITLAPLPADQVDRLAAQKSVGEFLSTALKMKQATFRAQEGLDVPDIIIVLGKDYVYQPLQDVIPLTTVADKGESGQ